jgi:hypothetical protein
MNDLEQRLADAISGSELQREPQSESKITQSLGDAIESVETPRYFEEDTTPNAKYVNEVQSERNDDEVMSEAVDRDWGEPQAVLGGQAYSSGYNISVDTLTSGFILRVGCQSIAVESGDDVGKLIGLHLSDKTIGDKWMSSEKIVQKFLQENLQVK